MSDAQDGTEVVSEDTGVAPGAEEQNPGPDSGGGDNPAWAPIREKLGDTHFQLIKPQLAEQDRLVNQRFQTIQQQYAPYKELGTPEELKTYRDTVQRLDADPVAFYQAIGAFLEENGRMPNKAEAAEIKEDVEAEAAGEQAAHDPRVDQLAEQQQRMAEFLQGQEQERVAKAADAEIETEISNLKTSKGYDDQDMSQILRTAAFLSQQPGPNGQLRTVSLEEAAQLYDAERERILRTPRPGAAVPRLLPTAGGAPVAGLEKKPGERTREETQDVVAAFLAGNRG